METFTELKALGKNPLYQDQRQKILANLSNDMLDEPIIDLINAFNKLTYCFTLQSCYGHFIYGNQNNPQNLEPLPLTNKIAKVEYRIAYIALCIEYSQLGKILFDALMGIMDLDPDNIQFGCAEWFWKRQINSYALQVEPDRFKFEDKAMLDYKEALKIEQIRNKFFVHLKELLKELHERDEPG